VVIVAAGIGGLAAVTAAAVTAEPSAPTPTHTTPADRAVGDDSRGWQGDAPMHRRDWQQRLPGTDLDDPLNDSLAILQP
jgi:hypothetical protein